MDRTSTVSNELKRQRLLAAQVLQKANEMSPHTVRLMKNPRSPEGASFCEPSLSSSSSFRQQQESINITELEEEKTFHMVTTPKKGSFEPQELAARSTAGQQQQRRQAAKSGTATADHLPARTAATGNMSNASKFLSAGIEEILAASFADNIRSMGRSLRDNITVGGPDDEGTSTQPNRADLSLPRTADMSKYSTNSVSSVASGTNPGEDLWDISQPAFDSTWMKEKMDELSRMEEVSFRDGEKMQDQLLEDELEWEQEHAIIPEQNAKARAATSPVRAMKKPQTMERVDFSCFSGYLVPENDVSRRQSEGNKESENDSHCSVGGYFKTMSDNLKNMIGGDNTSPPRRTPLPLIDMTNDAIESPKSPAKVKRTGNYKEDKENSLSVSSIARAIASMDLDDSPRIFIKKLQQQQQQKVQRTKSEQASTGGTKNPTAGPFAGVGSLQKYNSDPAVPPKPAPRMAKQMDSSRAKSPNATRQPLSDTMSISESMLESFADGPLLSSGKTSSPKGSEECTSVRYSSMPPASPSAAATPATDRKQQPLVDTYRVSTATKLSEEHMDLPPVPRIRSTPKNCQKNIFQIAPVTEEVRMQECAINEFDSEDGQRIAKPNRKRRSCSATRQELQNGKRMVELAVPPMGDSSRDHPRSRSPSNRAELKAVCGGGSGGDGEGEAMKMTLVLNHADSNEYIPTPKSSQLRPTSALGGPSRKAFLSPEPRTMSRSPYSSPKADNVPKRMYDEIAEKYSIPAPTLSRAASQCSGSSEWTHRSDGAPLPLKATHSELSWGSTRLRRSEKRSLQIKNISNRKLAFKTVIVGPGFQLSGPEQSGGLLMLQSQECRTITIEFCPTVIGPAVGALSFHPPNELHVQRVVSLFGYGGEASVKIEGIQKGPSGPFLELGSARNLGRPLEKSFSLYNKGSLPAFARIGIDRKGLDQAVLATAVYVHPQCTIIAPNSYAHIKVVFKPRRQEIAKILQKQVDVLSITNLHILWGDEPTRHRIRRNIATAKRNALEDPKLEELAQICNKFRDEQELDGLELFAEHVFDTIHELFLTFREYELVLTLDRALDDTMLDLSMADESGALFKTMYASSEAGAAHNLPAIAGQQISPAVEAAINEMGSGVRGCKRDSGESWLVRPTALVFRASTERTKQFVIKSNFYTPQYFELNCNYRQLFRLSPAEGHIRPGQEVLVNVSLQHLQPIDAGLLKQQPIFVAVYIENEKIIVPVQIQYGK
ncbi:uncharacterized protein LOC118467795 [Anopheles albimanus]|uniref:Uncharacterized protein n=1 Tax=Anopheles albimanus TaxID=7167 RepID=A0A182FE12_ANOAL|nr:uncharacterized protein LOC118467795 [Anopheles albimanus]